MPRKRLRAILIIFSILILIKVVTSFLAGLELYQSAIALRQEATLNDPVLLPPAVSRFSVALGRAAAEAAPASPILHLFGGDLCAAAGLIDAAGAAARFGEALAPVSGAALEAFRTASPDGVAVGALRDTWDQPSVTAAVADARRSLDGLADRMDCAGMSESMEYTLHAAQGGMFALDLISAFPLDDLLHDSARWVVALNNTDELRAVGGFTTAAMVITVEGGIAHWRLMNSYDVDNLDLVYYHPNAPEPLRRFMALQRLMFRDANWSPDYPTAAAQTLAIYKLDQGIKDVDGLITVNMTALETLVEFLPPLTLDGAVLTPEGSLDLVREAWNIDAPNMESFEPQRKDFLLDVFAGFVDALQQQLSPVDAAAALNGIQAMLARRDLMIYAVDPALESTLVERGWDGGLLRGSEDYLMVVDSDVGFNKVTPRVERTVTYAVDLSGTPSALLTLDYHNTNEPLVDCESVHYNWNVPRDDPAYKPITYEDRMIGCFWDYVRVLTPTGARIETYTADPIPAGWIIFSPNPYAPQIDAIREDGRAGFGIMTVTPPGESREVTMRYTLPESVVTDAEGTRTYALQVQKQPGIAPAPLHIVVTLPDGTSAVEATPEASVSGSQVEWALTLDGDMRLSVRYR